MLHQEFGTILLGFTKPIKCSHCNNEKPLQIRQSYVKQRIFLIPTPTVHKGISLVCSVCEHKDTLVGWFPAFAGKEKIDNVVELLTGGKEYTKYWISQLSFKDKEAALKRLNALNAYELVRYVGT